MGEKRNNGEDLYKYQCERYSQYTGRCEKLDDLAFKTSERHDQWVLTISGGALAVSFTFLEKFAPHPVGYTVVFLLLAWVSLVISLVCAFWAIRLSREAIYRQREIAGERHQHFMKTSSQSNITGDEFREPVNKFSELLKRVNKASGHGLVAGLVFLCLFAFLNTYACGKNSPLSDVNAQVRGMAPPIGAYITNYTSTFSSNHPITHQPSTTNRP